MQKILNKSKSWWRHGKHKGAQILSLQLQQQLKKTPHPAPMFSSVTEAVTAASKRRKS